mmetsp:Transcript_10475/g.35547  ORF Transcript_10475/g.35547 Transcript_10475/m.35547 type:complete len:185 (+) Transcript_10475:240-794(+)
MAAAVGRQLRHAARVARSPRPRALCRGSTPSANNAFLTPDLSLAVRVGLQGYTTWGTGEEAVAEVAPTDDLLLGLEGEVDALVVASEGTRLVRGDELGTLFWEGLRMSAADELYHSTFQSDRGQRLMNAPVSGVVVARNEALLARGTVKPLRGKGCVFDNWLLRVRLFRPEELADLLQTDPRGA